MNRSNVFILLVLVLLPLSLSAEPHVSAKGHFRLDYQSELNPLVINHIHDWLLTLRDADGALVADAELSVQGGMPAHNHGLPTAPTVEPLAKPGMYRLSGLRFHMAGEWLLRIDIEAEGRRDYVELILDL